MKQRTFHVTILIVIAGILLLGCSKSNNSNSGYNNNPPPTTTTGSNVAISNMNFTPSSLTVKAGTTVTWVNNDNITHTVTADDGSFTSGDLKYGNSYSHTFSTAGTYAYHCKYHSSMTGSVIVTQ